MFCERNLSTVYIYHWGLQRNSLLDVFPKSNKLQKINNGHNVKLSYENSSNLNYHLHRIKNRRLNQKFNNKASEGIIKDSLFAKELDYKHGRNQPISDSYNENNSINRYSINTTNSGCSKSSNTDVTNYSRNQFNEN